MHLVRLVSFATAAVLLLGAVCCSLSAKRQESWRWINLPDWHAAEKHVQVWEKSAKGLKTRGWGQKGYGSLKDYQDAMRDEDIALIARIQKDYGGELMVIPGDTQGGHWERAAFRKSMRSVYPDLSDEEVIIKASHLCYGAMRNAFAEAGYPTILVAVGDHEIGDNPWAANSEVAKMVPVFRAGHADVFNEEPIVERGDLDEPRSWSYAANRTKGERQFDAPIGSVPSRPLGTIYEETSFAWQYKNVLFITVDVFRQNSHGERLGKEGSVTGDVAGTHLQWFKDVLAAAAEVKSIKHIIVQSHLPVLYPVRKYASSGMLLDGDMGSAFWQAMREGGVVLYLAGEVHSNTVTIDPKSDLVQWVARGVGATNFSTVDVTDEKLIVQTWKNKDRHDFDEDRLLGKLIIDKSDSETRITTSGLLEAINPDGLMLHYDFDSIVEAGSVLTGVAVPRVNDRACPKAVPNKGALSNEYTVWADQIETCMGRIGKGVALLPGHSILGLSSMGPMVGNRERTIAMWVRSDSPKRQILLNTTSFWGSGEFFNLSIANGHLELVLSESQQKITKYSGLADGKWHHLVAIVPRNGASLSDSKLYIDGKLQAVASVDNGQKTIQTSQANWMGLGILLKQSKIKLDEVFGMSPLHGALDDFALWTRALTDAQVAQLYAGALNGKNASQMEQIFQSQKQR